MKRSTILKAIGIGAVVIGIVAVAGMILRPTWDVRVEARTIESAIEKKLPLTGTKFGVDYEVRDVDFVLLDDGLVRVIPNVHLQAGRFGLDAVPMAIGRIVYDEGVVKIADFKIEEINPTSDATGTPSRFAAILRGALPDSWEQKSKDAATDAVQKVFDLYPVYRLPNEGKMWWAQQAISKVEVKADAVIVSVDPFGVLLRIVIWIGIAILVLVGSIAFVVGMLSSTTGAVAGLAIISLS